MGAWIAVRGSFGLEAILLCLALLFWISGFDIIYATQDQAFDSKSGLHSLVVRFGIPQALNISRVLHVAMLGCLIALEGVYHLNWPFQVSLGIVAVLCWPTFHLLPAAAHHARQFESGFFSGQYRRKPGAVFLGIAGSILLPRV